MAKILRGVTQLNFDKKAEQDFDRKNAQLRVEEEKIKKWQPRASPSAYQFQAEIPILKKSIQ